MSLQSIKIEDEAYDLVAEGAAGTGLSKKALLEKAVRYYVPRVLRGEISVVERVEGRELAFPPQAGGAQG